MYEVIKKKKKTCMVSLLFGDSLLSGGSLLSGARYFRDLLVATKF